MYPDRHALRFLVYAGLGTALRSRTRWPKVLAVAGGAAYAREPLERARRRLGTTRERALAIIVVPVLMAWIDTAKMVGYVVGLSDRMMRRS
jgi:hypothetical protein